jgi:hypothetical protein
MAIALTTQPTADGLYSAYLPVKFVATETTNNPAYLEFELKTSAGASISNVPKYRALNVNNTYTFDASNYLKSILNVITTQGFSTTAIEELTDLYGKYEVEITDPINGVTALTSNEFYAFANIDGLRYLNDQTANDGINRKGLLYASEISLGYYATKFRGEYDRVVLFPQMNGLAAPHINLATYNENRPNKNSTIIQNLRLDTSPYVNKLISVPLNESFIVSNFSVFGGGFIASFISFKLTRAFNTNAIFYYFDDRCKVKEFTFINRYGVKENIKFETYDYESVRTSSESYLVGGYTHLGFTNYFNTSANNVKVNQSIVEDYEVRGNFFTSKHKGELQDFVSSPLHAIIENGEFRPINVLDGSFKLVDKSRGIDFNFKYRYAQKKPSFK